MVSYIVDGLPDSVQNKINLYSAKMYEQLQDVLTGHESAKRVMRRESTTSEPSREGIKDSRREKEKREYGRYYNCNETGYIS